MAYESRRVMTLAGQAFRPGDVLPAVLIEDMRKVSPGRLASLIRVGHLQEVSDSRVMGSLASRTPVEEEVEVVTSEVITTEEETPPVINEGDMCPKCGKGPFQRLQAHLSKSH